MEEPRATGTPSRPNTASRQRPQWTRRADIQGLRSLAVLLVVAYHADPTGALPGGFVGVDMFFVISGFVITGMIMAKVESPNGFSPLDFYLKRAIRLLPSLALMLVVVGLLTPVFLSRLGPGQSTIDTGIAASLFHANFQLTGAQGYFSIAGELNALLHTWSLAVEEQFYFVFPALLLMAVGTRRAIHRISVRRIVGVLGLVLVASLALSLTLTQGGLEQLVDNPRGSAFYSVFSRAWEFLAGALLVFVRPKDVPQRFHSVFGWVGMLVIAVSALRFTGQTPFPGTAAILPVAGTALLLVSGRSSHIVNKGFLSTSPMVWLGDRSYGWYLWHWPAIVFARSIWPDAPLAGWIAGFAALVPAALLYRYFENPIRHSTTLSTPSRAVPTALACIGIPLAVLWGVSTLELTPGGETGTAFAASILSHEDFERGCDSDAPFGEKPDACRWQADGSDAEVVLLGDSNAGHFTEGVQQAASRNDVNFAVSTLSGCPFVDVEIVLDGVLNEQCHRMVTGSLDALRQSPPDLILLAGSTIYVDQPNYVLINPETGERAVSREAKLELFERRLQTTIVELSAAGSEVIVVNTIPYIKVPTPNGSHVIDWHPAFCGYEGNVSAESCAVSVSRADIDQQRSDGVQMVAAGVAATPNASSVDVIDDLCTSTECSTLRNGTWIYRNGSHLSVAGAASLTDRFTQVIGNALADQ